MSDAIHETAATPSVSLAAVVTRTLLFVCVALCVCVAPCACAGRSVVVFFVFAVCRPPTKTKISRTHAQIFFLDVALYCGVTQVRIGSSLRSNKKVNTVDYIK